jgi:uncharacterized protein YecE (DUF72 family)
VTVFIGTSGWSHDHWKQRFYPEGLAKSRWFEFYASRFNCVEINATFYRRFANDVFSKWHDQAPEGFRYVLKIPRLISHRHHLINMQNEIRQFEKSCRLLQDRFGLMLLQLPPSMPYEPERLRKILHSLDEPSRIAIEFRDARWVTDDTLSLLAHYDAVYCNPDEPEQPLSKYLTGSTAYLRLHGRRQWYADNYTDRELTDIAQTVDDMQSSGAEDIYIFFNNDYEAQAPANATLLKQKLEQ